MAACLAAWLAKKIVIMIAYSNKKMYVDPVEACEVFNCKLNESEVATNRPPKCELVEMGNSRIQLISSKFNLPNQLWCPIQYKFCIVICTLWLTLITSLKGDAVLSGG